MTSSKMTASEKSGSRKTLLSVRLCTVLLAFIMLAALPMESHAAGWSTGFSKTAGREVINIDGFPGLQGLAFDTYTGKDGYCFTQSKDGKKAALIHFTMDSNGKCKKKKSVVYKAANVGHVNDAALFKDADGKKWIVFTLYGKVDEKFKVRASNGNLIKLGAISLEDFNKGKAKVYECDINAVSEIIPNNITGITHTGEGRIEGTQAPCFVFMSGNKFIETYVLKDNGVFCFVPAGSRARITKPKFSNGKEPSFQGVTYHKGWLYICAEGSKDKTKMPTSVLIARIRMEDLFNGSDGYEKKTVVFQKKITKQGKTKLSKNAPEAIFFTNLESKSRMYLSVNRLDAGTEKNTDSILRSTKTF